ncbi:hypothetical protein QMY03_09625 [Arthrobacter sp. KFRI-F3372]|nr:hypothetical protein QMY03_09625 [Arthrobacter sp. KFRI-F3372]
MAIEQVRYTWAKQGLQGYGMYQPVAASPGMSGQRGNAWDLALRLCRYEHPAGWSSAPRSFGWISHGDLRFAFSRCFLPDAQQGHPGNFAAHVVVAPLSELPVSLILESYASGFWWLGPTDQDPEIGVIPVVAPATMRSGSVRAKRDQIEAPFTVNFLGRILDGEPRALLSGATDELVAAACAVASRLPVLLEQRSFSTFEHGEQSQWFDLVREHLPGRRETPVSSDARDGAAFILEHGRPLSLTALLGEDTRSVPDLHRLRTVTAMMYRVAHDQELNMESLLAGLGSPFTIQDVLNFEKVQETVSVALRDILSPVWEPLFQNRACVDDETWRSLGRRCAAELGEQVPQGELVQRLERLMPRLTDAVAEEFLAKANAHGDLSVLRKWPLSLIRAAARGTISKGPVAETLRRTVVDMGSADWLLDEQIPDSLRLDLLQELIRRDIGVPDSILRNIAGLCFRLFCTNPCACGRLLQTLQPAQLVSTLTEICRHFPQGLPTMLNAAQGGIISDGLARVSPQIALEILAEFLARSDTSQAELDYVILDVVERYLEVLLGDPTLPYTSGLLGLVSATSKANHWRRLLKFAAPGQAYGLQAVLSRLFPDEGVGRPGASVRR